MNNEDKKIKFRVKYYFLIYLVILTSSLFLKFMVKVDISILVNAMMPVIFISTVILNVLESKKLTNYLMENHNEKWKEITSFMGTAGSQNGIRSIEFLFSDDYLNDEMVKKLKENYKLFLLFFLFVFITLPMTVALILIYKI